MILAAVIFEKKKVPLSYLLLTNGTPPAYLKHTASLLTAANALSFAYE